MSNTLAIADVTATLRKLIEDQITDELPGAIVTAQSPEKVNPALNVVNLFLYQTSINAAWRNQDLPRQVRPGETGFPPLALNLHYLLTAYGENEDAISPFSHRLLGRAMRVLHDHPVLSGADIRAAIPDALEPDHDLYDQIERVRITWQPLSLDDMSKLWSAIQAKYHISVAYEVSVVLIDSTRPARTPLPVLRRGPEDRGVDAQSNLTPPFPTLISIALPVAQQPSARLGDVLTVRGHHLNGDSVTARFQHPRLDAPIDIALPGVTTVEETDVTVTIPNDAAASAAWAAGTLTLSLLITRAADPVNPTRTTNELSFALAPTIVVPATLPSTAPSLTLTCAPEVRPAQRASLLFGGAEIAADTHGTQTGTLSFPLDAPAVGDHFLRLRVDGVDSLLIDYAQTPLRFDPNQKVNIT